MFRPKPGDAISIDHTTYTVSEHPSAPGMAYAQEGRAATVYQLASAGELRALKVFKPLHQNPGAVDLASRMASFAGLPGLTACSRRVLTPHEHGELLRRHPDLTYSVLMPWIAGPTWLEALTERMAGAKPLSPASALHLARSFATVLATMEQHGISHCDVSGPNVILCGARLPSDVGRPELIDVEQMHAPSLDRPPVLTMGSPGYARAQEGYLEWAASGDRFAGALMIAEMLGTCELRALLAGHGDSYFDPDEVGRTSDRYELLHAVLHAWWGPSVAALLQRAWASTSLAGCATFGEWLVTLPESAPTAPPDGARIDGVVARIVRARLSAVDAALAAGHLGMADEGIATASSLVAASGSLLAPERTSIEQAMRRIAAAHKPIEPKGREAAGGDPFAAAFDRAREAMERGDDVAARDDLRRIVERQPDYARHGVSARSLLYEVEKRIATRTEPERKGRKDGPHLLPWALLAIVALAALGIIASLLARPTVVITITPVPVEPTIQVAPPPDVTIVEPTESRCAERTGDHWLNAFKQDLWRVVFDPGEEAEVIVTQTSSPCLSASDFGAAVDGTMGHINLAADGNCVRRATVATGEGKQASLYVFNKSTDRVVDYQVRVTCLSSLIGP